MKKRLLALLLASIMTVSVCACGGNASEEASNETGRVPVENYVPTYPIVEEPITIKALVVGQDMSVSATRKVWDEVAKYTNIYI